MMPKVEFRCIVAVLMMSTMTSQGVSGTVYEIYAMGPDTDRSMACGVCEAREGHLARRPILDEWEILFGNLSHLQTMNFWVDLIQTDSGDWYWGDSVPLDLNDVSNLPMKPDFDQQYIDHNCALWNMGEPFLMPAFCNASAYILCELPTSSGCQWSEVAGLKFDASYSGYSSRDGNVDFDVANETCVADGNCWAFDFDFSNYHQVLFVEDTTGSGQRPPVPPTLPQSNFKIFGKTCVQFKEVPEEDSDFVCNCGAIELPVTEEEKEQFVEEFKEEVKKELIVPTETLSATVRKKESAPDERPSSTGIGYLGIGMLAFVFGTLLLLDLTSLFADLKTAFSNIKSIFIDGEQGSSDA